jgi:hypothetical protein
MTASTTARRLAEAVSQATKSSRFCVAGCLAIVDLGIEVDGWLFDPDRRMATDLRVLREHEPISESA